MDKDKALDLDLLVDVIVGLEMALGETGRRMGPVEKAEHIVKAYKEFKERRNHADTDGDH